MIFGGTHFETDRETVFMDQRICDVIKYQLFLDFYVFVAKLHHHTVCPQ